MGKGKRFREKFRYLQSEKQSQKAVEEFSDVRILLIQWESQDGTITDIEILDENQPPQLKHLPGYRVLAEVPGHKRVTTRWFCGDLWRIVEHKLPNMGYYTAILGIEAVKSYAFPSN